MHNFNRSRTTFDCMPDCPERKPGCHDTCERYKKKRAAYDKRKLEYYGNPEVNRYFSEKNAEVRDSIAKKRKEKELRRAPAVDK